MRAAADFGCGAGAGGRGGRGGRGILREGSGPRGRRKIRTGTLAPAPRACPRSHCWPGWRGSGRATAPGPAGGPGCPAPP